MTEEVRAKEARRPRRTPTPLLLSCEEHNILEHSQYRSWFTHCVVGRGFGQRHVASEQESGGVPKIMMDYGYMNGVGLGAASQASQATGS